jgi:hypothetical protein
MKIIGVELLQDYCKKKTTSFKCCKQTLVGGLMVKPSKHLLPLGEYTDNCHRSSLCVNLRLMQIML